MPKKTKLTCGNCLWLSAIHTGKFDRIHGYKYPCRSVATKAIEVYEDDDACPAHSSLTNPEGNSHEEKS